MRVCVRARAGDLRPAAACATLSVFFTATERTYAAALARRTADAERERAAKEADKAARAAARGGGAASKRSKTRAAAAAGDDSSS